MRQVGVLAAAAWWHSRSRRKTYNRDHKMRDYLAEGLAQVPAWDRPEKVQTNIVIFDVRGTAASPGKSAPRLGQRKSWRAPPTSMAIRRSRIRCRSLRH